MRDLRFAIAMKFSSSAPQDCAGLAPQLTALFDGEADDAMASQARAHLLSCPACSRQWLDWTRYRDTFQSEPALAPPPTLLWRVLISYRVAAFARPARRHSKLPQISATPLREIEAPLPPRLTQHILSRTTRKPSAHVMLTPTNGPDPVAKSRFQGRSFSFRHAPLWAAPALALWILMLGRADFTATLPVATPESSFAAAASNVDSLSTDNANSPASFAAKDRSFAPIPIANFPFNGADNSALSEVATGAVAVRTASQPMARAQAIPLSNAREQGEKISPALIAAPPANQRLTRADGRSGREMNAMFLMALNAGRRDIARARTVPRSIVAAPATQVSLGKPVVQTELVASPQQAIPIARIVKAPTRVARRARVVSEDSMNARVTLAALASPVSPIRIVSAARVRAAAFSEDSLRPRVAHLSADGRRLARLLPEDSATPLRFSRPIAGKPTLRETSLNNGDNGPKLDELRSAVDDFRASVSGDE